MAREVICDSGVLISLTSACLDKILYFFTESHGVKFIIPPSVEYETVERPMKADLRKHLFSAVRIKAAIEDGVLKVVDADVESEARRIMNAANSLFYVRGKPLRLIHYAESEMLALGRELEVNNVLVDERTSRMLIEAPFRLKEHFETEFKTNVMVSKNSYKELASRVSSINALRSSELVMLAYENGYFKHFGNLQRAALEAALNKMKFAGCSIGFGEISAYMSTVR